MSEETRDGDRQQAGTAPGPAADWREWGYWAAIVACLLLMLAHVWHFLFLCDDAYIFFRYARNLVRGRGLVFNPGEYVEGYTSLLWVVQIAFGEALGVSGEYFAHLLSLAYTLAAVAVWSAFVLRQPMPGRRAVLLIVLLALATNRNWALWSSGGLETRSFTFFLLATYSLVNRAESTADSERRKWALVAVSTYAALAVLARPDALVFFPLVVAYCLWVSPQRKRDLLPLVAPFAVLVGGHFLWRHWYYGDWLPNTYYAKVGPPWPEMGARFLGAFVLEYALYLVLPVIAACWWRVPGAAARRLALLMIACIAVHAGYYCYKVGGDHFEFRIFDFYVPVLVWMFAESLLVIARSTRAAAILVGGVALAYSVMIPLADLVQSSTFANAETWIGPPSFHDFEHSLKTAAMKFNPDRNPAVGVLPMARTIVERHGRFIDEMRPHLVGCRHEYLKTVWLEFRSSFILGRGVTDEGGLPDMTMAASGIGALGYFIDLPLIDTLGLTDRVTAHEGVGLHPLHEWRVMAHDRLSPIAYLEKRHAHVQVASVTTTPVGASGAAWVPIPKGRTLEFFSLQLANGNWLNFVSWDPKWVRQNFRYDRRSPNLLYPRES